MYIPQFECLLIKTTVGFFFILYSPILVSNMTHTCRQTYKNMYKNFSIKKIHAHTYTYKQRSICTSKLLQKNKSVFFFFLAHSLCTLGIIRYISTINMLIVEVQYFICRLIFVAHSNRRRKKENWKWKWKCFVCKMMMKQIMIK